MNKDMRILGGESFRSLIQSAGADIAVGRGDAVAVGGIFDSIAHAVSSVTQAVRHGVSNAIHTVSKGMGAVANLAGKIPVIGTPLHTVLDMANSPFTIADRIASGARLDHVALDTLKDHLSQVRTLAPYAQTVVSMVPGIGQGVNAAVAVGAALAQGRPITEAAMNAVRAAIPGGELAQKAFDIAKKVASGKPIAGIALEEIRNRIPEGVRSAFDTGLALANGRRLQDALVSTVQNLAPQALAQFTKTGGLLASANPVFRSVRLALSNKEKVGFDLANGVLAHAGVPEQALLAFRKKLGAEAKRGFDAAIASNAKLAKVVPKIAQSAIPSVMQRAALPPALAAMARPSMPRVAPPRAPTTRAPTLATAPVPAVERHLTAMREGMRKRRRGIPGIPNPADVAKATQALESASRVIAKFQQANLAKKYGHPLTAEQVAVLKQVHGLTERATAGDPKAKKLSKLLAVANRFRQEMNITAGFEAKIVPPGTPTGQVFIGGRPWDARDVPADGPAIIGDSEVAAMEIMAAGAGGFSAHVVEPGTPTGQVFIGGRPWNASDVPADGPAIIGSEAVAIGVMAAAGKKRSVNVYVD
jgi:hypothetical protein